MSNDENISENNSDEIIPDGSLWDINSDENYEDNPFDTKPANNKTAEDDPFDTTSVEDIDTKNSKIAENSSLDVDDDIFDDYGKSVEVKEDKKKDSKIKNEKIKEQNRQTEDENVSIIINKIDDLVSKIQSLKDENKILQDSIVDTKLKLELAEKKIVELEEDVSCKELEIQSILKKVTNLNL